MRKFNIAVNGVTYEVEVEELGAGSAAPVSGAVAVAEAPPVRNAEPAPVRPAAAPAAKAPAGGNRVLAPMPGTILSIAVKPGQSVKKGDLLLMLEAMKMENEIRAGSDGVVASIAVREGETVNTGQVLVELS